MKHTYRPDIDGLRALAVLSVVVFHAFPAWLPGGFIGVDIFFVISGYLITGIIAEELREQRFSVARFYARRILRIFPALCLVLTFCLGFGWFVLLKDEYQELGKHTLAGAAFVQNLTLWSESGYFALPAEQKVLLHLWSLGIEEQFYIFWPIALLVAQRMKLRLGVVVVTLGVLSLGFNFYQSQTDLTADFFSPLTRVWELLIGAWLALRAQPMRRANLSGRVITALSVLGAVLTFGSLVAINRHMAFPGGWAIFPVVGAACLLASGQASWLGKAIFSNRVVVWFGLISYPLYLWHWPLLTYVKIIENGTPLYATRLLLVCLAILLSWLTYRFLERPLRLNVVHRKTIVLALIVCMCVLAAIGYSIVRNDGFSWRRVVVENLYVRNQFVSDANPASACPNVANDNFLSPYCLARSPVAAKKTIVLWGDSSVVAWAPVFETIAKNESYNLIRIAMLSCPPILNAAKTAFTYAPSRGYCADGRGQQAALEYIKQLRPDLVVVIAAWNSYGGDTPKEFLKNSNGTQREATAESTKQVLKRELPATILTLADVSKVLVFRSWPVLPALPNTRAISLFGKVNVQVAVLQDEFVKDNQRVNNIFDELGSDKIHFFSPADKVCDGVTCHAERSGIRFYSDAYHVSPEGALSLQTELEAVLKQILEVP
jgi:peptidoglycan/LPS O-acetylase OafA/YrhL